MLQHVWWRGPRNTSVMHDDLHWLVSECSTSWQWQSMVVFGTELHGTSPTAVYQSPKFWSPASALCQMSSPVGPRVCHSTFGTRAFFVAGPKVCYSMPDICVIQLSTLNNLGGTWGCICSLDIRSISALEVLRNRTLQIDIYLLTAHHLYCVKNILCSFYMCVCVSLCLRKHWRTTDYKLMQLVGICVWWPLVVVLLYLVLVLVLVLYLSTFFGYCYLYLHANYWYLYWYLNL